VGSSGGSRTRGCPALVQGEGGWPVCSLRQGLCCCCSLFCQRTHQSLWQPAMGRMNSPPVSFFSCLPSACPPGTQLGAPTPPVPLLCPDTIPLRVVALSISGRESHGLARNLLIICWLWVAEQAVHVVGTGGLLHPPRAGTAGLGHPQLFVG